MKGSITIWIVSIVIVSVVFAVAIWWFFTQENTYTENMAPDQVQTQSSEKSITSFSISGLNPGVQGTIDETDHTVTVTVPAGTDVTDLTPNIIVSDYAIVSPSSGSAEDFTNPVIYTVVAQDGSTQTYTATVNVAAK